MSSFLCFICHNAVNADTTEETREKYREVVEINLCPDSHLCYICCHMVNKLWLFKSVCIKRSHEYPVLFSEKCTINLHRSDIDILALCSEETCMPNRYNNENRDQSNDYVKLEDKHKDFDDYIPDNITDNDYTAAIEAYNSDPVTTEAEVGTTIEYDNDADYNDVQEYDTNDNEHLEVNENDLNGEELINEVINDDNENNLNEGADDYNDINEGNVQESETTEDQPNTKEVEKDYEKILLSVEEQKGELEAQRRSKKYLDAEFKCYNCAMGFLFKDSYQAHMMRHEESNGEYLCLLCTLRFASPAVLRSHKAVHRERYICCHCGVKVRKRQRDTHARKCHKREEDSAACHLCGNVFQDASGLQQHLKRFHMSRTSNRTYSCSACGKNYEDQAAVRTHMIKHIQRKFSCDQCPAKFSSPYTLTQHKKKHTSSPAEKPHSCDTCGVRYSSRKSLLAHWRTAMQHQNTVYDCPICSRICPNSSALSSHISRVHSTSKDFACSVCGHRFSSRKSLLRHVRGHRAPVKAKDAQCHLCGKNFKGNSKLNRHLREVCGKDRLEEELAAYQELRMLGA